MDYIVDLLCGSKVGIAFDRTPDMHQQFFRIKWFVSGRQFPEVL